MQNRDKKHTPLYPVCPTLNEVADKEVLVSRRWLLEKLGLVAAAGLFVARPISKFDALLSAERWPDDEMEIIHARGSEHLPVGGDEWLVFGGFGQKYSVNAAQELFNAIGGQQVVSSIKYPNQGFTIPELAKQVEEYIRIRRMKSLNIVGVSMGLPTAIMALRTVQDSVAHHTDMLNSSSARQFLPTINYMAAYSSPADSQDAMNGELAQIIANLAERTGYRPGVIAKMIYSMFDGNGDKQKAMNIFNRPLFATHLEDSLVQTWNDCPPGLVLKQMPIISAFNVENEWQGLRNMLTPGNTQFFYCAPSGPDATVNNPVAAGKYESVLNKLHIPTTVLDTGPSGHANTVASALALGQYLASTYVPQNDYTI